MNTDESTIKREKLLSRTHSPTVPNSARPSEGASSDSGSEPGKERLSVTTSGKEGKFLRIRLAKALAAGSMKGRSFKTKREDGEDNQIRDKARKQLVKEPTQEIDFQDKENVTKRAKGSERALSLDQMTVNVDDATETNILTSSSPFEAKNPNYYSTKTIQRLADETVTVSNEKKTHHSPNLDWKTLLQARPRDKKNNSRIPVLVPSGGDKAYGVVSLKSLSISRKPQETPSAKPDLIRKTSDQCLRQLPKPTTTSLSGVSAQKGNEISEDVEKRLEHARHMLQKRRLGSNKEELLNGQGNLLPNEAVAKEGTENDTVETDKNTKTKSKVAVKYDGFDALENELIYFKENIFKTMEEFEDLSSTAKQLQHDIENVRAERLQVFSVPALKSKIHGTKLPSRNGTQNTADSVYIAML